MRYHCLPLGLVLLSGCAGSGALGLPVVSLPARVELAGGQAWGELAAPGHAEATTHDEAPAFRLRAGLHPLHLFPSLVDRSFDVGGGYLWERMMPAGAPPFHLHGFYLEGAYWPLRSSGAGSAWRLGVVGSAEAMLPDFQADVQVEPGATMGLLAEWVTTSGSAGASASGGGLGSSAVAAGAVWGEWGFGLSLTGSYRQLETHRYFCGMAALSMRLPLAAAIIGIGS